MTVFQALVLGVVQGLGEFLPISSSAHLVLAPWAFGWQDPGLSFDVALHMGTLLAVVAFFWRDWLELFSEAIIRRSGTKRASLFWYLVAATIPGALAGYLLEDQAETTFRNPLLIAVMLIAMGVILYLVDRRAAKRKGLMEMSLADSLLIGLSQAFAIIPGVSRSGVTMTAGRSLGFTRETAARFSFLLSTPIIFGAGVMKLKDISAGDFTLPFIIGIVSSAVVGFLSIGFLLRYLTERSFTMFVWYRFALGLAIIGLVIVRTF
ncbi:undecaprenyl-diphosphatase UppP [Pelotomaculum propionicicum]|uniref:Undecaprenyl-diphosphatase n=1 Tax=Pelotomaculum propionicicum TaxID=258475 RepID=A0A4Y7RNA0_9FIRM|nr:undecaprenyl-diphosphatase UppP [Pelotomaculum propionicicum]TEB09767.1 Undecaprenyl-diphosphatase [Pelotomaculum propionicicum]